MSHLAAVCGRSGIVVVAPAVNANEKGFVIVGAVVQEDGRESLHPVVVFMLVAAMLVNSYMPQMTEIDVAFFKISKSLMDAILFLIGSLL